MGKRGRKRRNHDSNYTYYFENCEFNYGMEFFLGRRVRGSQTNTESWSIKSLIDFVTNGAIAFPTVAFNLLFAKDTVFNDLTS